MEVFGKLSSTNGCAIAVYDERLSGQTIRARLLCNDGRVYYSGLLNVTKGKFINTAPNGGIAAWARACARTPADYAGPKNERNAVFAFFDEPKVYSLHFSDLERGSKKSEATGGATEPHKVQSLETRRSAKREETIEEEPAMSPEDACAKLHQLLKQLPLYDVNTNADLLPKSCGIYYFYEKTGSDWEPSWHGGCAKGIVRIGISGGTRGRISDHCLGVIPVDTISLAGFCPKDRSVMRKHIGRALVSRAGHPHANYLPIWNADMTTRASRESYRHLRNIDFEKTIEREVSDVIARNFSFRCVPCNSTAEADDLETSGIGIVSSCPVCRRSPDWLGRQHPNSIISQRKLWNVKKVTTGYTGTLRLELLAQRIRESLKNDR